MQAPTGQIPVLVTPGCWEGVAGKDDSGLLCFLCFFLYIYISSTGLSWRESQSDIASVLTQHCHSWTVSSALCTDKFHLLSITSIYSCKVSCRSSEPSEIVINLLPYFVLISRDQPHGVPGRLSDGPSPVVSALLKHPACCSHPSPSAASNPALTPTSPASPQPSGTSAHSCALHDVSPPRGRVYPGRAIAWVSGGLWFN